MMTNDMPMFWRRVGNSLATILILAGAAVRAQTPSVVTDRAALEAQVETLLARLTPEQKMELLGGQNGFYTHAQPSIGLPAIRMADGPMGVRNPGPSTAYPAGIALAATFDTEMAFAEGSALGRDAHARGVSILLGPGVNIYRAPMNGRNFEYFGEDPFLSASMAVSYIQGVQRQGVGATVKHFALNNEEYDRHKIDSVVDERTLHEIYLPAFEAAVKQGHVAAIMDAYNLVNGEHATQNKQLNAIIAKGQWGFDGLIMSDWHAVYDGVVAVNTGLDLEMPSAKFMSVDAMKAALQAGTLTQATIDDHARRLLRTVLRMGWMTPPVADDLNADNEAGRAVARKVALESITLLKNDGHLLPLDRAKVCTLAVIGPNADDTVTGGGGSSHVLPVSAKSLIDALSASLPKTMKCSGVVYSRGLRTEQEIFHGTSFTHGLDEKLFASADGSGEPLSTHVRQQLEPAASPTKDVPKFHSGQWIADYTPTMDGPVLLLLSLGKQDSAQLTVDGKEVASLRSPEEAMVISHRVDGNAGVPLHLVLSVQLHSNGDAIGLGLHSVATLVSDEARALAAKADAVVLAVGFNSHLEGEGFDRTFALPGAQDELIRQISSVNAHTIVAADAGGGFDMVPWIASVPAVVHLWYPGEEGAPVLADILFGKANPEGHLPISIERSFVDNPSHDSYYPGPASKPGHPVIRLSEGVFLGYRFYADAPIKPLFAFGFGLSYTQFKFSHLHADTTPQGVTVTLDVSNTGTVAGGEAVQIYVGDPSATVKRPAEELKAFRKIHLEPKEATHLVFNLDRRAFSWWNPEIHDWQMDPGKFTIMAGDASDNLSLHADIEMGAPAKETSQVAATPSPSSAAAKVSALFPTNPAPAYNGTKEFSITVKSTKLNHVDGKEVWETPTVRPTRVMEQLAGFTPKILPTDKWGGRMDISEKANGFFYTKMIGDRWWAIDPAGHAYFHIALVDINMSSSPNGKAALATTYGDAKTWIAKTHALMLQNGFNGAGAWSNVDAIRQSPLQANHPLAYTVILNFMANYGKKRGGLHDTPGHAGFPNDTIFAFDPDFPKFVDEAAKSIRQYADDPALFGYFSDNELPIDVGNLDRYLLLPHDEPGYKAAKQWMSDHNASQPNDDLRKQFLTYECDRYYSIVYDAIRRNDPNHMYLGSRITGKSKDSPEVLRVLGKYSDAISVNYYNSWTPDTQLLAMWAKESGKPEIITEWYTKGADSGMPNKTGAGWLVATQAERGEFYQNYALMLIQSKSIVGWHWFKYQDNDPNDPHAELSNKDANKGIVNIKYQLYAPLVDRMRQLNPNAYALADYFDARPKQ